MSTQPRYRHSGCQKGRGQAAMNAAGLDGFVELGNRQATAAESNDRFMEALRLQIERERDLATADRIEAELCGGLPPRIKALKVEAEAKGDLTTFERSMNMVKAGAGIRTEPPMPRPQPQFTLGGVQPW